MISESSLRQILADPPPPNAPEDLRFNALFSLGNLLFRKERFSESVAIFEEALRLDEGSAELRANLGSALFQSEESVRAVRELRKALLLNPELHLAQIQLGYAHLKNETFEDAEEIFQRLLNRDSTDQEALRGLVFLRRAQNQPTAEFDHLLLETAPGDEETTLRIAEGIFYEGREQFLNGNRLEAYRLWASAYQRTPRIFIADEKISSMMRKLQSEFESGGGEQRILDEYRGRFQINPADPQILYPFLLDNLFLLGLLPEVYEEQETLSSSVVRWNRSLEDRGEHPYPHFRLSIIYLFLGQLPDALREIQICVDKLPVKKQHALKITQLRELCSLLTELGERRDEFINQGISADIWERAGFVDPFQLRAWRESGLSPEQAASFRDAEFSPKQAREWSDYGVSIDLARRWKEEGFSDPYTVRQWIRAGVSPVEAKRWEVQSSLPLETTVQYLKAGVVDPAEAMRWAAVLQVPFEAAAWRDFGFTPEDAALWRDTGFTQPSEAAIYRTRGLSPDEALREYNNPDSSPDKRE